MLVTRCTPLPSAFMNQMSKLESGTRELLKAIFVPSADHAGSKLLGGSGLRFWSPVPSGLTVKIE